MTLVITDAPKLMQISNLYQLLASALSRHETLHSSTTELNFLSLLPLHTASLPFPLPKRVFYSGISFKLASFTEVS